jgi:hypothetical protein
MSYLTFEGYSSILVRMRMILKIQVFQDVKWHCWVCSGQPDPDSEGTTILQNISNQPNDKALTS